MKRKMRSSWVLLSVCWISFLQGQESSSRPIAVCELAQTLYPLLLQYGPKYLPLASFSAQVSLQLHWKLLFPLQQREVICLLQVQDQELALLGSDFSRLETNLFLDANGQEPVIFFTGQNFEEAGIVVPVDEGLPYLQQSLTLQIPARQKRAAGSYRCFVDCSLYTVEGECLHRQPIQLLVEVADYQLLSLCNTQETSRFFRGRVLDFGNTTVPSTQTVELELESNEVCELSVVSLHGGKLVLREQYGPNESRESCIPYDCWVEGSRVPLETVPQSIWVSSEKPFQKNVEVMVRVYPDPSVNWAGVYEDEIVFCLKPTY